MSLLFFVVPAAASVATGLFLGAQDSGSFVLALQSPTFLICAALGVAALIWGGVFVSRPIVTLTQDGVDWPNGRKVAWADVQSAVAGQTEATAMSANAPARSVVHEVVRLNRTDGEIVKIVTTWAAIGPEQANDQIIAAFDASR